jgi:histidine phosphotransferase ChpT
MLQAALPDSASTRDMLKLSELLAARFSHDITGPVGAVNNGAEFLQEGDDEMQAHAVELIANSAREAVSKIVFYRHCYGHSRSQDEVGMEELQPIAAAFYQHGNIKVEWQVGGARIPRDQGRLLLNLLYLASASLIRGGVVSVQLRPLGDMQQLVIKAEGQTVKYEDEWMAVLKGEKTVNELTPRSVQVYLTLLLAAEHASDLHYQITDQLFELTTKLKHTILVPEASIGVGD